MTTTLDIAPAGMALLDAAGTVLGATPGFGRALGFDTPVGRELSELLSTFDDPAAVESALARLHGGEAVELEAWLPAAVS